MSEGGSGWSMVLLLRGEMDTQREGSFCVVYLLFLLLFRIYLIHYYYHLHSFSIQRE